MGALTADHQLSDSKEVPKKGLSYSKYRNISYGLGCFTYIFVFFYRLSMSVLLGPIAKDLNKPESSFSFMSSMYFWSYAVLQPVVGSLADILGAKTLLVSANILLSLGAIGMGASPNITLLSFSRFFIGVGAACVFVPCQRLWAAHFQTEGFRRACSSQLALGGFGGLLATTPVQKLSEVISWRAIHFIAGAISLVVAGFVIFFVGNTPEEKGYNLEWRKVSSNRTSSRPSFMDGIRSFSKSRHFYFMSVAMFISTGCYFVISGTWGGQFLEDTYNKSGSEASYALMALSLAMIIGAPALNELTALLGKRGTSILSACINTGAYVIITLFISKLGDMFWTIYPLFFCIGLFGNSIVSVVYTGLKELYPSAYTGTVMGCFNGISFFGAALLTTFSTWLMELGGKEIETSPGEFKWDQDAYKSLFGGFAILNVIAIVCVFFTASSKAFVEAEAAKAAALDLEDNEKESQEEEDSLSIVLEEEEEENTSSENESENSSVSAVSQVSADHLPISGSGDSVHELEQDIRL